MKSALSYRPYELFGIHYLSLAVPLTITLLYSIHVTSVNFYGATSQSPRGLRAVKLYNLLYSTLSITLYW